jgi:Flp pilus assembly protein TadG
LTRLAPLSGVIGRACARVPAFGRDQHGAAAVEFAIVAPVLCIMLLGALDIAHTLYMHTVLQGVIQKVGRDSTLESGADAQRQQVLDDRVRAQVHAIANNGDITITRRFYRTFTDAAQARAEVWTDTNNNGGCDDGEPYEDANLNGNWDADGGNAGQGGAKDATLYTVTVSYPRFFPIWRFIGGSDTTRLTAQTVLRNQPYSDQGSYGAKVVRNCPAAAA